LRGRVLEEGGVNYKLQITTGGLSLRMRGGTRTGLTAPASDVRPNEASKEQRAKGKEQRSSGSLLRPAPMSVQYVLELASSSVGFHQSLLPTRSSSKSLQVCEMQVKAFSRADPALADGPPFDTCSTRMVRKRSGLEREVGRWPTHLSHPLPSSRPRALHAIIAPRRNLSSSHPLSFWLGSS